MLIADQISQTGQTQWPNESDTHLFLKLFIEKYREGPEHIYVVNQEGNMLMNVLQGSGRASFEGIFRNTL